MLPSLLYIEPPKSQPYAAADDWAVDLDLAALVDAMAGKDAFLANAARSILMSSHTTDVEDILYRQAILADALGSEDLFVRLYDTLTVGLTRYDNLFKASQPSFSQFMPVVERVHFSAEMLGALLETAEALRVLLLADGDRCGSSGMRGLIRVFLAFFHEEFMRDARAKREELNEISNGSCLHVGARLGNGLKGTDYHIRRIVKQNGRRRPGRQQDVIALDSVNLQLKAIELRDALLSNVLFMTNAVNAQTAGALKCLRKEIGFYAGCARLHKLLKVIGVSACIPVPALRGSLTFSFRGLTDVGLALRTGEVPVPNGLVLDDARLVVITGANQGGKSTFLRSVGLAQVMLQSGMFAAADQFASSVGSRIFTHFCRGEDGAMDSGKLDEELRRMDRIVDEIGPNALLLMNESFASTTEREGSGIAREITGALHTLGVRTLFVTHNYHWAKTMGETELPGVVLLRAERSGNGLRTFRMLRGVALPKSFGMDLYRSIIGE